jgi:hypothetical protein
MKGEVRLFRLSVAYLTVRSIIMRILRILLDVQALVLHDLRYLFTLIFAYI